MTKNKSLELVKAAVKGLQKLKGVDIVTVDLSHIENIFCKYFVICNGTSNTHVRSLADSAIESIREICKDKPIHSEGQENAVWVLVDYADIIVHVFQEEYRDLYRLEQLWEEAIVTKIKD